MDTFCSEQLASHELLSLSWFTLLYLVTYLSTQMYNKRAGIKKLQICKKIDDGLRGTFSWGVGGIKMYTFVSVSWGTGGKPGASELPNQRSKIILMTVPLYNEDFHSIKPH